MPQKNDCRWVIPVASVGGVLAAALIAAALIMIIPSWRKKVFPFLGRGKSQLMTTPATE
jgi:hypothetical protein